MRSMAWFLFLSALAVGLALLARSNEAYVLFVFPEFRVEVSLNFALITLIFAFITIYSVLRLIDLIRTMPGRAQAHREQKRKEKAASALQDSLRYLFEGRFTRALKYATQAHAAGEAPGIAALIAARSAQRLRDPEKQEMWLNRADQDTPGLLTARLMLEAELLVEARHFGEAIAVLQRLQESEGKHIAAMRLELRAQQGVGHWEDVLRLVRQLEKRDIFAPEVVRQIKRDAHLSLLKNCRGDAEALQNWLKSVPVAEMSAPIAAVAANDLAEAGLWSKARQLLENTLKKDWDSRLLLAYGKCPAGRDEASSVERLARIAQAEQWLKTSPQDAVLLYVLGRLCDAERLWGKARSYYETSLSIEPGARTHLALAALAETLEDPQAAYQHYRSGAQLASA